MVSILSTKLSQGFPPIPTVCQKIDFTGDREPKSLKHLFDQGDFGLKGTASFSSSSVIEFSPKGQKEVSIEQSRENPLVAKDMGFVSLVLMPSTSWHLLARLFGKGVIHDKKENRMLFNPQGMKKLMQNNLCDLFHCPDIVSEESGEA